MTLTLLAGAIALLVTAALLIPLFRGAPPADGSMAAIYEDQLAEVSRDEERGLLAPDQAAQARNEVERRLLEAARRERREQAATGGRSGRFLFALCAGALPLAAAGIYLATGNPNLPDTAFADRVQPAADTNSLRARLIENADDLAGWIALGDALSAEGRRAEAAPAYAEAVRLTGGWDRRVAGAYAEALALDAGQVTAEAEEIFAAIKEQHPDDPQATYYLAQAKAARGETEAAADDLRALLTDADPNAPWYGGLSSLLAELEAE